MLLLTSNNISAIYLHSFTVNVKSPLIAAYVALRLFSLASVSLTSVKCTDQTMYCASYTILPGCSDQAWQKVHFHVGLTVNALGEIIL